MSKRPFGFFDLILHKIMMRRWGRIAAASDKVSLDVLRRIRLRALEIRQVTDRVLFVSNGRLALPIIGSNSFHKPLHSDWSYRPMLWRGPIYPPGHAAVESKTRFGEEVTLFHDCRISELTVRQLRNGRESDLAPFGFRLDVFEFDGSFLSLVVDLPDSATRGLQRKHILRMSTVCETEKPLEIFVRLNIQHGPNTEQLVRELPLDSDDIVVDFDLAYTNLNEKRVDRAWVDLIFEGPEMNQIMLRDVTFSRRPRAEV